MTGVLLVLARLLPNLGNCKQAVRMRPVEIEVLLLRTLAPPAAGLAYRVVPAPLDRATPNAPALRLAELAEPGACHSTSWRSVRDTVVLTYAALPDPHPGRPAVPLDT